MYQKLQLFLRYLLQLKLVFTILIKMIIMSPFNQCLCYVHVIWWVFRYVGYFQYLCATTVVENNYKLFLLPMLALFIMLACPL